MEGENLKIASDDISENKLLEYIKYIVKKETMKPCILCEIFRPVNNPGSEGINLNEQV